MIIEEMMNEVIKARGFEDKYTIWFCGLCEDKTLTHTVLENAMVCALCAPIFEEDE